MDVSDTFYFPDNLALEVFDSEALGLPASYMVYYFSQTVFYPEQLSPSRTPIQIPHVGIVFLSFEMMGHVSQSKVLCKSEI